MIAKRGLTFTAGFAPSCPGDRKGFFTRNTRQKSEGAPYYAESRERGTGVQHKGTIGAWHG